MEDDSVETQEGVDNESFSISELLSGLLLNPINVALLCVIVYLLYQLFSSRKEKAKPMPSYQPLSKMKRQDMTSQQLKCYDGKNTEGRVCVAVNGKIFDCTKGKQYYGPGGPYEAFAGRDASRGFAKFSVETTDKDYDDLSDLSTMEMDSVREWEMQFQEKYDYVGRLLKPGEEPTDYSDEDENSQDQGSQEPKGEGSSEKSTKATSTVESSAESVGTSSKEKDLDSEVFHKSTEKSASVNRIGDPLDSIQETSGDKEEDEELSSSKSGEGSGELAKELPDKKAD